MGPKTKTAVTAAVFMITGVTLLALARAEESFILGANGGYVLAFIIAFTKEGKRREAGLWTMAGITGAALFVGTIQYAVVGGDPTPVHFALGLLIGGFPGTVLGWPPPGPAESK